MGEPSLREVVEALRQELGQALRGIVLFGSRARGKPALTGYSALASILSWGRTS